MVIADYLTILIVFMCVSINRHSIVFLLAFTLNEYLFFNSYTDFDYSIMTAMVYVVIAEKSNSMKLELQSALAIYSFMFWLNALDYWLTDTRTYFYVIFPYVIKFIDIYVIYHLIHKEQGSDRFNSAPFGSFN